MKPEKTAWQKPQLIVLARSRPEEAVLTACKTGGVFGPERTGCGRQKKIEDCAIINPS